MAGLPLSKLMRHCDCAINHGLYQNLMSRKPFVLLCLGIMLIALIWPMVAAYNDRYSLPNALSAQYLDVSTPFRWPDDGEDQVTVLEASSSNGLIINNHWCLTRATFPNNTVLERVTEFSYARSRLVPFVDRTDPSDSSGDILDLIEMRACSSFVDAIMVLEKHGWHKRGGSGE